MIQFTLLGQAQILLDSQALELPGNRPLALLAYLLVSGQPHSREHLVDLFFERPYDPRAALRWTLSKLRKSLGDEVISADRQTVSFNFDSDYTLDVELFLQGDLDQYSGEFLEGLHLQDARGFENWLLVERERLRAIFQAGLEEQLSAQIESQDAAAVEKTAIRLMQLDNLREDWLRVLMSVYAQQGKFEAALNQYEFSRNILREELDQEPAPATRALAEEILKQQEEVYRRMASDDAVSFPAAGISTSESQQLAKTADKAGSTGSLTRQTRIGLVAAAVLILAAVVLVITNFDALSSVVKDSDEDSLPAELDLSGTTVLIEAPFDTEGVEFLAQSMSPLEERTGIDVEIRGILSAFDAYIVDVVAVGNPPDIANFAGLGPLVDFARQGELIALDTAFEKEYLQQQFSAPFLELVTVDGHVYGIPHLAALKGLIWYPKKEFEAAGYEVPSTWDDLMALSGDMVADGRTPWCIGIEAGSASGWIGTDWVESLLLRTAPPEVYDAWTEGELAFDSPEIRRVFGLMEPIWLNRDYVYGGTDGILETPISNAPSPLFEEPPHCFLHYGATFSPVLFPPDAKYGEDYDYFVLPAVDPEYDQPLLGAGGYYAIFNDRPEVREVMRYLTTGESAKVYTETGVSVSSHRDVPLEWYATPLQLQYAQLVAEADIYRFDGSDLMPGEVGVHFWQGIVDWVEGEDLDEILQEIDDSWPGQESPG